MFVVYFLYVHAKITNNNENSMVVTTFLNLFRSHANTFSLSAYLRHTIQRQNG